jgi:hypothetical protein
MRKSQSDSPISKPAIANAAVILIPSRLGGILMKVLRADIVMLFLHRAATVLEQLRP